VRLVTGFLSGADPATFDDAESRSYPAWLDALAHGESVGPGV
jgi:hypothetical protein